MVWVRTKQEDSYINLEKEKTCKCENKKIKNAARNSPLFVSRAIPLICDILVRASTHRLLTTYNLPNQYRYYMLFFSKSQYLSDKFHTDCFCEFFTTKSLRSRMGFDDLEEYQSSKATFEELKKQNSYFIADLTHKQENDK